MPDIVEVLDYAAGVSVFSCTLSGCRRFELISSVHSHFLPLGIFSLPQFMQYEPESIRKRFATVVPVLARVGVVTHVSECSFFKLIELTVVNSSSINEMLFLTWSGPSV